MHTKCYKGLLIKKIFGKDRNYAVLKSGGKQYRVSAGDVILVEKIIGDSGSKVTFQLEATWQLLSNSNHTYGIRFQLESNTFQISVNGFN